MVDNVIDPLKAIEYGLVDASYSLAIDYDSFVSFKLQDNSHISSFAVEEGAFASYNKAATPYKITVQLALSGDPVRRSAFLKNLRAMLKSTDLFIVLTPDAAYTNANLISYAYTREAKHDAYGRITAELHFEEVRVVALQYTSTKVPAAKRKVSTGKIEPTRYSKMQHRAQTGRRP